MPTSAIQTWSGTILEPFRPFPKTKMDVVEIVAPGALTNYKKGTVFGQVTASRKFAPYDDSLSNGTEVAKCILPYDITVNTDGTLWFATTTGSYPGPNGETKFNIDMYFGGCFLSSDLYNGAGALLSTLNTGADLTNALADFKANFFLTAAGVYEFWF